MTVYKDADEGQLDGLWVSMGTTMARRATTFAPELIAVSITTSIHLSLPLSLSIPCPFLHTHTATLRRIELPTTAVTHDVVDTLNQRWRPRRIREFSLYLSLSLCLCPSSSLSLSRLDIYLTMQRNVIPGRRLYPGGIPIAELHYIVAWRKQ